MSHIPDRGDIVTLDLNPAAGREVRKVRPVLVMTPARFNRATGMAIICPITTRPNDSPFEVRVAGKKTAGAVLPQLIRSLDWKARHATLIEKAPAEVVRETTEKLAALIGVTP